MNFKWLLKFLTEFLWSFTSELRWSKILVLNCFLFRILLISGSLYQYIASGEGFLSIYQYAVIKKLKGHEIEKYNFFAVILLNKRFIFPVVSDYDNFIDRNNISAKFLVLQKWIHLFLLERDYDEKQNIVCDIFSLILCNFI